jgi:hypothetical protein
MKRITQINDLKDLSPLFTQSTANPRQQPKSNKKNHAMG